MMRAGMIGAGLHSLVHMQGYEASANVELEAIYDVVPGRAEGLAREHGIPTACSSIEELLSIGLDLIDVVTPPLTHLNVVDLVMDRVHVICEKPLALDVGEAQSMCSLAESTSKRAFTAFQRRYDPALIHIRSLIRDKFIGDIVLANCSVIVNWGILKHQSQAMGYRQWLDGTATGGGFVSGALPHYADLVRYLLGDVGTMISHTATAGTFAEGQPDRDGPDDTVILAGSIAGGGVFNIAATWAAGQPTQERWEIAGSKRTLVLETDGRLYVTNGAGERPNARGGMTEVDVPWLPIHKSEGAINRGFGFGNAGIGFGAMVSDIAASIESGGAPLCATFQDGLRSAEIIARLNADTAGRKR
jgi:predicted dehydrogenase